MIQAINLLSGVFLSIGALFILVGSIGLLRMPDVFTRMHAAGITDTIGAAAIILGLMLIAGWSIVLIKLLADLILVCHDQITLYCQHRLADPLAFRAKIIRAPELPVGIA